MGEGGGGGEGGGVEDRAKFVGLGFPLREVINAMVVIAVLKESGEEDIGNELGEAHHEGEGVEGHGGEEGGEGRRAEEVESPGMRETLHVKGREGYSEWEICSGVQEEQM